MNNAAGMIRKNYVIHFTMAILCALVSFVGSPWLGFALGAAIYGTFLILQFGDGCDRGERACTLTATMEKMISEGRAPEEAMKKQVYKPANAVKAFLWSSLPFAVLACVNLVMADPNTVNENLLGTITRLVFFPAVWLTQLMAGLVGVDYAGTHQASAAVVSSLTRDGFNFASMVGALREIDVYAFAYDFKYLTYLRALYIPISFLSPLCMMLGYLNGPKLRAKKLRDIARGVRRKRKKLKVFGKPKQPRQIKPEV